MYESIKIAIANLITALEECDDLENERLDELHTHCRRVLHTMEDMDQPVQPCIVCGEPVHTNGGACSAECEAIAMTWPENQESE